METRSSSQPRSRRSAFKRDVLTRCVICGSRQIRVGRVTVRLSTGRVVKNVRAEICMNCGERYFDPASADKVFSGPVSKHAG